MSPISFSNQDSYDGRSNSISKVPPNSSPLALKKFLLVGSPKHKISCLRSLTLAGLVTPQRELKQFHRSQLLHSSLGITTLSGPIARSLSSSLPHQLQWWDVDHKARHSPMAQGFFKESHAALILSPWEELLPYLQSNSSLLCPSAVSSVSCPALMWKRTIDRTCGLGLPCVLVVSLDIHSVQMEELMQFYSSLQSVCRRFGFSQLKVVSSSFESVLSLPESNGLEESVVSHVTFDDWTPTVQQLIEELSC